MKRIPLHRVIPSFSSVIPVKTGSRIFSLLPGFPPSKGMTGETTHAASSCSIGTGLSQLAPLREGSEARGFEASRCFSLSCQTVRDGEHEKNPFCHIGRGCHARSRPLCHFVSIREVSPLLTILFSIPYDHLNSGTIIDLSSSELT